MDWRLAPSSAAFKGAPTGITTRAPVLPWRNRIVAPSYAVQVRPSRSPLALPSPKSEQQGQVQMRRALCEEGRFVRVRPHAFGARGAIDPAAALAWVDHR